jgi:Concanavalin A-like lectin/glucanases superfamily/Polysaccharide lyase
VSYESEVLADSPRLYLRLGEASGTTAADSSGKAHNGTYKNTPTLGVSGGVSGDTAVKFDGSKKHFVEVADHNDLDLGDTFTLEGWVKREKGATNQTIIAKGANAYQLRIEEEENKLQLLKQGNKIVKYGAVIPEDGKWHHVVATKSGSTIKMYVDGVQDSSGGTNATCENTATAFRVGCSAEGSEHLTGGVDEIAVYATALSEARIKAHFEAASAKVSEGKAAGTGTGTGTAKGTRERQGKGAGTGTGSGAAAGIRTREGKGAGSGSGSGAAKGTRERTGKAAGAGIGSGSAAGTASTGSVYGDEVLSDGPRGYWRLGEKSGTTAADSSGKAHNGTYKNTPTLGVAGAIYKDSNPAASFDSASSEFVEVADHADLDLGDSFTLEAWVKPGSSPAEHSIIAKGTGGYQMRLGEEGERELQLLKQDSAIVAGSGGVEVPDDGGWHHCVVTKNGSTVHVYIDGVDVTSAGTSATCEDTATALRFGCKSEGSEQLNGGVDEVAVYAGALGAARILAHYEAGATPFEATPADSCWEFDGDATDSIGENDGEAVGAPSYGEELVTSEPDGEAIDLNGSSQYVKVPDDPSLRLDGSYWLTAWAELGSITGIREIIRKGNEYRLYGSDAGVGLSHQGKGAEFELAVDAEFVEGRFYRIDAIFDEAAETLKAYVNGRLIQTVTDVSEPPKPGSADLNIGARGGNEDRYWDGRLDKVRIRGVAPTAAEVLAEYREESDIVFADGFESGFSMWGTKQEPGGDLSIVSAEPDPLEGSYEMRAAVDPGGERAEVIPGHINFSDGDDIYVRDHFYLEPGFAPTGWGALFFQGRQEGEPEEKGADSPLVALLALPEDGEDPESPVHLAVVRGPVLDIEVSAATYWLGPEIETGRWYDICIRIKFSEDPKKGLVEVWLDGVKQALLTSTGRTARGESYPKFGLYRDTDITTEGVAFHDQIAITRSSPFAAPGVTTGAAAAISPASAALNGTVDPNGLPTTYWFEYGETKAYGSISKKVEGLEEVAAIAAEISGLDLRTVYHFRLVAENAEGKTLGEDATFTTGPPAPRRRRKPPLELDIEVETPDGFFRLPCDSRKASRRAIVQPFSTQRGDGFTTGGVQLARQILKDYPDIALMDTWRAVGRNGDVAYEGRLASDPRTNDPGQISVQLVGWATYLKGRKIDPLIIDRRASSWQGMTNDRKAQLLAAGWSIGNAAAGADPNGLPALVFEIGGNFPKIAIEALYDAGSGNRIAEILWERISKSSKGAENPSSSFGFYVGVADDDKLTGLESSTDQHTANEDIDAESSYTPSTARRWARMDWELPSAQNDAYTYSTFVRTPAVIGDHGLTLLGSGPDAGPAITDVIDYILARFYPKVQRVGPTNIFSVSQADWHDNKAYGYEVIQQLNNLILWETSMREDRQLHIRPADLTRYDWQFRTDDPGVRVVFQGDSIENFANGIEVTYTDFSGTKQTLYPTDHSELRDDSESNPANRHGESLWTDVTIDWPVSEAEALQIARAYLAEFNRPKRPGTYKIGGGYIKDGAGHWHQGWKPKDGETVGIMDLITDEPRLITNTTWDPAGKVLEITVDAPSQLLDAIAARQQIARQSRGLA